MEYISRCAVCEPEDYYQGKSGLECKNDILCDSCVKDLAPAMGYMQTFTGDPEWTYSPTEVISTKDHADCLNAYFAGAGIQYWCLPVGCQFEIRKQISWVRGEQDE